MKVKVIRIAVLIGLALLLIGCASNRQHCDAYGNVETTKADTLTINA